jgi:hypothetical protein
MGGAQRYPSIAIAKMMGFAKSSTHPTGLLRFARKHNLATIAHEAAGALGIRRSPRPLRAEDKTIASGASRREGAVVSVTLSTSLRAKRSNPSSFAWRDGLLRGACHRSRIRATRWLAMTVVTTRHTLRRHRPPTGRREAPPDNRLRRAIQYSEASVMESRSRSVLDTRMRGYDGFVWGGTVAVVASQRVARMRAR